jgi:tetratricopeptide (TPR) repeat protein
MKTLLILTVAILTGISANGIFMPNQTEQVPIDRLFKNLEQRLERKTNDFVLTYQLARLHAMAYATNQPAFPVGTKDELIEFAYPGTDAGIPRTVQVKTNQEERLIAFRHLTNAITQYNRALLLLRQSTNQNEQRWHVLPIHLGLAWCLDQAGRRDEALAAYRKTLKIAWTIEVTGEFDLKAWLRDTWKDVQSGRNPIRAQRRGFIGPGVSFSEETIGYLLKLLDPVKDAKEIAQLKADQVSLRKMGRAVTPILVPMETGAPFEDLVDRKARVTFDLDGTGWQRPWSWISPKAAWLVYDHDGSGRITSALQMFGNVTFWIFWRDGYEALSSLDDDGDGVLQGTELRGLALWQDRNGNGISESGEVQPVARFGIEAIKCYADSDEGGIARSSGGVTFADGSSRPTYDWIAHAQSPDSTDE